MTVKLYFDHNISGTAVRALRTRGVDVLTAFEDSRAQTQDESLLQRATELGRVLVSHDHDFLRIAVEWQRRRRRFVGVVLAPQDDMQIGTLIQELEYVAVVGEPRDFEDRVEYLPLR